MNGKLPKIEASINTQIHQARCGVTTDQMKYVAQRESLKPEVVREEVARGRMVIHVWSEVLLDEFACENQGIQRQ